MEAWIPITLAAAFLQNARSALQKRLQAPLSTLGAAYARFIFAVPFALAYFVGLSVWHDGRVPLPNAPFAAWAAFGGIMQILATVLLIAAFRHRGFAVATVYSKTETVQVALAGLILLGDRLSLGAVAGILVGLVGVGVMAGARGVGLAALPRALLTDRAAHLGIASGAAFALSAIGYRAASLSLGDPSAWLAAGMTLACVTGFQTIVMGAWLRLFRPGAVGAVIAAWRQTAPVGLVGMLASACWFTAMTLEPAAHVRALGQVELVFTFLASMLWFREKPVAAELLGAVLVVAGILLVLLAR